MLYPRRRTPADPAASDRELAVAAAILFVVAALFALTGVFEAAFAAFAGAMACQALRSGVTVASVGLPPKEEVAST
jgi:hypothetical protein